MKMRKLRNLEVSAVGLGRMGFSHGYGAVPERKQSVQLIGHAFERGCTHFDTVNPVVPVEEVAESMGKLISEGKILGWGLSEATVEQIRRAHAITPLTAVQSECSMMERMFERDVIPLETLPRTNCLLTCRRNSLTGSAPRRPKFRSRGCWQKSRLSSPFPARAKWSALKRILAQQTSCSPSANLQALETELAKIEIHGNRTDEDIAKLYRQS